MRITLSVLLATFTIYCNSTVLSLPPSLIATAASLRQHHSPVPLSQQSQQSIQNAGNDVVHALLKKDAKFLLNGRNVAANGFDNIAHLQRNNNNYNYNNNNNNNGNNMANGLVDVAAALGSVGSGSDGGAGAGTVEGNGKNIELLQSDKLGLGKAANQRGADFSRKLPLEYDLNALLDTAAIGAADATTNLQQQLQQQQRVAAMRPRTPARPWPPSSLPEAAPMKEFFTPLKYWIRHCRPSDHNCPQEYYRALLTDRSRAPADATTAVKQMDELNAAARSVFAGDGATDVVVKDSSNNNNANVDEVYGVASVGGDDVVNAAAQANGYSLGDVGDVVVDGGGVGGVVVDNINAAADISDNDADNVANNDVLMLINGEQDVMKFLSWAMEQLYPYQRFVNYSKGGADYYHPGMYIWKKLNLSGRLEPPLWVEEPHYIIVRRERLEEDLQSGSKYKDDPFIPPRGRKHNMPDLDALLHRYEPFVPNRGKRDKIKDIFKYDDLFYPNRGKKQKPPKATKLALLPWWDGSCEGANDIDNDGGGGSGDGDGVAGFGVGAVGAADSVGQPENAVVVDVGDDESDDNLTAPPSTVAMRRTLGKLRKRLRQHKRKRCMQQQPLVPYNNSKEVAASNEINYDNRNSYNSGNSNRRISNNSNNDDSIVGNNVMGSGNINTNARIKINSNSNSNRIGDSDTDNDVPIYTTNEDDQSVKASAPAREMPTEFVAWQPAAATSVQQQQWHSAALMNTRLRRVAGTFAGAARVAANRLHSMSTMAQQRQHQQQRQQHQHQQYYQQQQHYTQQQQQQQLQRQQKQLQRLRNAALAPTPAPTHYSHQWQQQRRAPSPAHHNDLDLLLWRQLQQQQQRNPLPLQQSMSAAANEQQSPEMQFVNVLGSLSADASAATAAAAAADADDIDYFYLNI